VEEKDLYRNSHDLRGHRADASWNEGSMAGKINIIRKVEDEAHHAHHGGGWKVAYADLMTAMMAFFLLMWLLSSTEDSKLIALADYFTPTSRNDARGGGEGLLWGEVVGDEGIFSATGGAGQGEGEQPADINEPIKFIEESPITVYGYEVIGDVEGQGEGDSNRTETGEYPYRSAADQDAGALNQLGQEMSDAARRNEDPGVQQTGPAQEILGGRYEEGSVEQLEAARTLAGLRNSEPSASPGEAGERISPEMAQAREDRSQKLEAVKEEIGTAVRTNPDLPDYSENIQIEEIPEGLLIQIVDRDQRAMFESGSFEVKTETRTVIDIIGKAIVGLDYPIDIIGHTDARPFRRENYSNWELSTDRANATRRALVDAGVPPERIARISGLAETSPLNKEDPEAPENRRISILLQYPDPILLDSEGNRVAESLRQAGAEAGVTSELIDLSVPAEGEQTLSEGSSETPGQTQEFRTLDQILPENPPSAEPSSSANP
jgi:chemotaxis protein MotB